MLYTPNLPKAASEHNSKTQIAVGASRSCGAVARARTLGVNMLSENAFKEMPTLANRWSNFRFSSGIQVYFWMQRKITMRKKNGQRNKRSCFHAVRRINPLHMVSVHAGRYDAVLVFDAPGIVVVADSAAQSSASAANDNMAAATAIAIMLIVSNFFMCATCCFYQIKTQPGASLRCAVLRANCRSRKLRR